MKKNHYYLTPSREYNFVDAGTNKREAIKAGKEIALKEKTTYALYKCRVVEGVGTLGRFFVGMLEFPYYLRSCQLDTSDITVNLF